jgi:hypothetical protein
MLYYPESHLIPNFCKAFAKHMHGVDWDYHHHLGLINRTSFLLNYLSDIIDGAQSYSDWINGDLYERTDEHFGICEFPGMCLILINPYATLTYDLQMKL